MAVAVIMPKQGQSVESCILTELRKRKGDKVAVGDVLFAYETDKASFEEEAKEEGTVLEVFFAEGDEIPVLANVMVIGAPGESADGFRPGGGSAAAETPAGETAAPVAVAQAPERAEAQIADRTDAQIAVSHAQPVDKEVASAVSPRARGLARKYGVDAAALEGSGPEGRVIAKDVIAAIDTGVRTTPLAQAMMGDAGLQAPASGSGLAGAVRGADLVAGGAPSAAAASAGTAPVAGGGSVVKPLSNMRKLIAKAMHASLQNSAQLTHHLGADARRVLELRRQAKAFGSGITINDLVCFAVIKALKKFPQVNSHFLGDGIRLFDGVHLGLAVDTERGLMVPAVRNADGMTIAQLSEELKKAAAACKSGSINPDLLSPEAASFTVSNLGNYGVEMFTPVINLPQSAILGVNAIVPRPKDLGDGVYAFVPYMGLSLTYDHRALDGGEATRFLKQIATEMENLEINF